MSEASGVNRMKMNYLRFFVLILMVNFASSTVSIPDTVVKTMKIISTGDFNQVRCHIMYRTWSLAASSCGNGCCYFRQFQKGAITIGF